jgi:hypothetical protein
VDVGVERLEVPHFVQGEVRWGADREYRSRDFDVPLVTPAIDLDDLVLPRSTPGPAFDTPLEEIIDFLVECGEHLRLENSPHLQESIEKTSITSGIPVSSLRNLFSIPLDFLTREALEYRVERNFGSLDALDTWLLHTDPQGRTSRVRAVPPRLIHMVAGNAPIGVMLSIADGALVKGVNVFKVPSVDPFTTSAVLRTMADVDPSHPVVRSMSAIYWRGGDAEVENVLYRAQYFDKVVAWGGGDAITNVAKYVGPGFQLVSFDPKVSIAVVGREALATGEAMREAAELAASDAATMSQDACVSPRFVFVEGEEGTLDAVDAFCALLQERMGSDRHFSGRKEKTPGYIRDAVDGLRFLEPDFRVWGAYDGNGLVVRSFEPVDFHPVANTLNVVVVPSLLDAARYVNVATQTVGVYPHDRKAEVRDRYAYAGAQRIVPLGSSGMMSLGAPHDGMYPLHRFVSWVVDEDA